MSQLPRVDIQRGYPASMDTKRLSVLSGALQDIKDVLSGPDDLFSRWWLLCHCGLRYTAKPMKLYGSKGEAEQALDQVFDYKKSRDDKTATTRPHTGKNRAGQGIQGACRAALSRFEEGSVNSTATLGTETWNSPSYIYCYLAPGDTNVCMRLQQRPTAQGQFCPIKMSAFLGKMAALSLENESRVGYS